jgi:hypothetical protein
LVSFRIDLLAFLFDPSAVDSDDVGMIVSLHKTQFAAGKAAAKVKHSRVQQLHPRCIL